MTEGEAETETETIADRHGPAPAGLTERSEHERAQMPLTSERFAAFRRSEAAEMDRS